MHDPLLELLPGPRDADRPWLNCYTQEERVELTGRVLSMWLAKIAGLITAESAPGDGVHLGLPPHWRTVVWTCGTWLAGRPVLLGTDEEIDAAGLAPELSVAFSPDDLCDAAEVQVLVPAASLALRWPGELPALVLDGAADLMSYPDAFAPAAADPALPCLIDLTAARTLTRTDLAGRFEAAATASGTGSRACLVRRSGTAEMMEEVLLAWRTGRTAVVLTPEASDDVAAAAIRQEGITPDTEDLQGN